jgi:hypothetical protein
MARQREFQAVDLEDSEQEYTEPDEYDNLSSRGISAKKLRMIDWIRALKLIAVVPIIWIICALVVGFITPKQNVPLLMQSAIIIALISIPITLVVNFMGYVFDPARNRLSYPVYVYRRSIPLSEITDANCEMIVKEHRILNAFNKSFGATYDGKRLYRKTGPARIYAVDVSGEFGVRQMRFGAKYKRNQFLGLLRKTVPQCRITRWT